MIRGHLCTHSYYFIREAVLLRHELSVMTGDFLSSSHLLLETSPVVWITAYDGTFCAVPCVLIFVARSPFLIYPPWSCTPGNTLP